MGWSPRGRERDRLTGEVECGEQRVRERRVGHEWLVDPIAQRLEGYKQEAARWLLLDRLKADARVRVEPFEAIEFDIGALWAR